MLKTILSSFSLAFLFVGPLIQSAHPFVEKLRTPFVVDGGEQRFSPQGAQSSMSLQIHFFQNGKE